MYLESLTIRDLKLIRDLTVEFTNGDGSPRMWTVFVGENGVGKTALLQAIAMVAAGETRANQLAELPALPDRRLEKPNLRITARLTIGGALDGPAGRMSEVRARTLHSEIDVPAGSQRARGSSRWARARTDGDNDPLDDTQTSVDESWFVLGYGVGRQLQKPFSAQRPEQTVLARLAPLFDPLAPTLGTGFADILEPRLSRTFGALLKEALVKSELLPRMLDLELRGRGGVNSAAALVEAHRFVMKPGREREEVRLPATWLSQGYQAMIAWIADIIGHALLHVGKRVELQAMNGLVLVDELDLFLHPTWQEELIAVLRTVFPHVQFVATTHSPMVLTPLRRAELLRLEIDDATGDVVLRESQQSPRLMTGSELYARYFEIDELSPRELNAKLRDFVYLANDPFRSAGDDRKMRRLRDELDEAEVSAGFDPVPRRNGDTHAP